jgi:translation initiation factor 4E
MDKDNLWTRRSKYVVSLLRMSCIDEANVVHSSSKLSLSTPSTTTTNGPSVHNDHPTRNYTISKRYGGDSSSHGKSNPFNTLSPSTNAISSPTAGASSAFGLGSGAFASFGSAKAPKSPGNALDLGSVVGVKPQASEKSTKDVVLTRSLAPKASNASLSESKNTTPPPAHTLRYSWVFWFRPPISKSNGYLEYEKTLHAMAGFSTAEDFFTIYRHLKRPSTLPLVSDYHIFKKGIRPVWEDEENKRGGKWIVRLKKGVADRYWEDLVFAIIGDQFAEASEEVCGAVLSVRNGEDILSIWTRNDGGRVLKIR